MTHFSTTVRRPLRHLLAVTAWAIACASASASPLLSAEQTKLAQHEPQTRIIDIAEAKAYALQHLPGAVSAPYARWRGGADNPGELLPLPQLTSLVQEIGLNPDDHVIIVYTGTDATDFGSAARVYWTLKTLGATRLSILNGGVTAWKASGLPISSEPVLATRSQWQPQLNLQWLATRDDVHDSLSNTQPALLVDSRPLAFFEGRKSHPAAKAAGTIPGAVDLDNADFFASGSAALLAPDELSQKTASVLAAPGQSTIAFCNTGHWAATDWFVLSEVLGHSDIKLYPGSMVDWTQASTPLPLQSEPSRLQQLRYAGLSWAHRNLGTKAP